jgi:hypothetical protein
MASGSLPVSDGESDFAFAARRFLLTMLALVAKNHVRSTPSDIRCRLCEAADGQPRLSDISRRRRMLSIAVVLWLCATEPRLQAQPEVVEIKLGQVISIDGGGIQLKVLRVSDPVSRGCLGGPRGCQNSAQIELRRGKERKAVILRVPRTVATARSGIDTVRAFGYRLTLSGVTRDQITLAVEHISR